MKTIVHKIKLRDSSKGDIFEDWVTNSDYATCPEFPSLLSFDVQKVSARVDAPFHYFEIIRVSSKEAFEKDMESVAFKRLIQTFSDMAVIVEEIEGSQVGKGYLAGLIE